MSKIHASLAETAFSPGLLALQDAPPPTLPRRVLWCVSILCLLLICWSAVGRLDIVASADGRLVPQSYVKIVQPAEAGIIQQILVREGAQVKRGDVLIRMNSRSSEADRQSLAGELALKRLELRRIDAELGIAPWKAMPGDDRNLFAQVEAKLQAHRQAWTDQLAQQRETVLRAEHDQASADATLSKLHAVAPLLKQQADAYADLARQGFAGELMARDKQREYLEKTEDTRAQAANLASLKAAVAQARERERELASRYTSDLRNERVDIYGQIDKLQQAMVKEDFRSGLMELRAPQDGTVKDLATHTVGAVVAPGTVLLSVVPVQEHLIAEILVQHEDVGFIEAGMPVSLKLRTFPFQQYGLLPGRVIQINPDVSDTGDKSTKPQGYRAIVALDTQRLRSPDGTTHPLVAGMQLTAEIREGNRTVLQYLLSPIWEAVHDSARER